MHPVSFYHRHGFPAEIISPCFGIVGFTLWEVAIQTGTAA